MSTDKLQAYFVKRNKLADLEEKSKLVRAYLDACSKRKHYAVSDTLLRDAKQIEDQVLSMRQELLVDAEAVNEMLDMVTDDISRMALKLHYLEGHTWKDVAAVLHTSTEAVKKMAYRQLNRTFFNSYGGARHGGNDET